MLITAPLPRYRLVAIGAAFVAAVVTLAACGGSSGDKSGASPAAGTVVPGGGTARTNRPGTDGKIAAIAATTMQVQNPQTGQVAVRWTATTKFTHPVSVALTAVKAGDCVVAASAGATSNSSPLTATEVMISAPVNGQCGGPARAGGQGPGTLPSGAPRSFPSGTTGGFSGTGSFVAGKVTSVSGSSIVVAARQLGPNSSSTTSRTVSVDAKTKISTQRATTSKSLRVGLCVNAQGKADSAGTVTATSVRITPATNGQCTFGFVGTRNG